ncbi:hypothetical protein MRX96_006179 [Rhipicephalus microplus]
MVVQGAGTQVVAEKKDGVWVGAGGWNGVPGGAENVQMILLQTLAETFQLSSQETPGKSYGGLATGGGLEGGGGADLGVNAAKLDVTPDHMSQENASTAYIRGTP